jgi:hypothetical protein
MCGRLRVSKDFLHVCSTPTKYRTALQRAGFEIASERNRKDFALEHFAQQQAAIAVASKVQPLGLQTLMRERRKTRVRNMIANISSGLIAPVEMIAQRRSL